MVSAMSANLMKAGPGSLATMWWRRVSAASHCGGEVAPSGSDVAAQAECRVIPSTRRSHMLQTAGCARESRKRPSVVIENEHAAVGVKQTAPADSWRARHDAFSMSVGGDRPQARAKD